VQRFAASYEPPPLDELKFPVYLGGWPSANFFADQGLLVLSTLLYSGQVLAKDPISDWFSPEQYRVEHVMSSRQGYLDEQGKPNIVGTRRFLGHVVPALQALRPLIESGAIVLVPGESFFAANDNVIKELRGKLLMVLAQELEEVTRRFDPSELAVDDRRRGMFTFAGGEKEQQLRAAVDGSLRYFAREWLLAQGYGAEYTAPWAYEQYVCERGLDKLLMANEHQRTVNALLSSELPIFQGLTPRIVADVRDDDTFTDFRSKLYEVYRSVPNLGTGDEFRRHLAQTEETVLRPVLDRAEREARRGFLSRLGVDLTGIAFSIAARVAFDAATGQLGWSTTAARETLGVFADGVKIRGSRSPLGVWTKLYRHHRTVGDELHPIQRQIGSHPQDGVWSIDDEPSDECSHNVRRHAF
jgi:hypothetical protein